MGFADVQQPRGQGGAQISFEQLLDFVPDAALAVGDDGAIVLANPQAAELFGYAPGALIGRRVDDLVPARFRASHPRHRADYHDNPQTRPMGGGLTSLYGQRADGSEFPAEIMLSTVAAGARTVVVAAVRDVSERSGQRVRARLAAVIESSTDAILAKDRDGLITDWNPAAEKLYGYSREEMVGQPVLRIVPADRQAETAGVLAAALAGESVPAYETVRVTKGGERVDVSVSISAIRDTDGRVSGASTISRDIRERLRAESERSYIHAIFENSADAIVAVGTRGEVTSWNPAAERLFGYSSAEALGRQSIELIGADEQDAERATLMADVLAGHSMVFAAHRRDRDRRPLDLSISLSPIRGADGEVTGAVSIVRDVSAVVQAETQVTAAAAREAELRDELHQTRRLESIGQLAGGVAHDFNNLLGVILNYAQFVLDEIPEESRAREDIEEIRRAAARGADLTRQLLIFSRKEVVRPEVFDVNELIAELEKLLRRALGERVELRTTLQPDLWRVHADRGQLEQVIINVALNGRDAMPDGGTLDVQTSNVVVGDDGIAQHAELEPGHYLLIEVTDSGTGMAEDVMRRAFEPFFTTKAKGEGTGLGLATVYGIVKEAGGRVSLYSEGGFGTSVKVFLPATDAPAPSATSATTPAPCARGETILLVEDQDEVRRMVERILIDAGYAVLPAAGGQAALEIVGEHLVDLMLTDVIMPGMLGPELADRARAAKPGLKVIFMSGYSDRVLSHGALSEEADLAFIEKPFSSRALQVKVRQALDAGA